MADMVGSVQNVQLPNPSGVNIQIFNPAVNVPGTAATPSNADPANYNTNPMNTPAPSYPPNYYTQNLAKPQEEPEQKKTEKREIVEITDDYVKNLESYLNDGKNEKVRIMAANEVLARLHEDPSRKDDPALNALINKMLKDPCQAVKSAAIAALETKIATGNNKTVEIVKNIQQKSKSKNKLDAENSLDASNALLKMSSNVTEKEFEVKDQSHKES